MAHAAVLYEPTVDRGPTGSGSDYEDQILVDRTADGDGSAFDSLVRRYYGRATATALRYSKDSAAVPDIVSTAFTKAFLAIPKFRGQCRFSTWLHRIVVNTAYDSNERQARLQTISFDEARSALPVGDRFGRRREREEDFLSDGDATLRRDLIAAFRRLPVQDQALLLLRHDQDLSYEGLAQRMGIALGTVKSRLHRARRHLQSKMSFM